MIYYSIKLFCYLFPFVYNKFIKRSNPIILPFLRFTQFCSICLSLMVLFVVQITIYPSQRQIHSFIDIQILLLNFSDINVSHTLQFIKIESNKMQLLQEVSSAIKSNTQLPITTIVSDIDFRIQQYTTYNKIVQKYDPKLRQCFLKQQQFLNQKIILIQITMTPEDMHWLIWKNYQQISDFLLQIDKEIELMLKTKQFQIDKNGNFNQPFSKQIALEFRILKQQFKRDFTAFNLQNAQRFVAFMNKLGQQTYLRKTIPFMIFISHCISIDKWNVMTHYQTYVYKDPISIGNKIIGFFKSVDDKKEIDYFVTVGSDEILISDDHLLLSKIKKTIPFTNQMKINSKMIDENLVYEITSGRIESIKLNFYRDYARGINFGCSLGRALKFSGYNFLMGLNSDYQNSHMIGYDKQYIIQQNLTGQNRFSSYAQQRHLCNAKLYSDGCGYYEDLYNELMKAEKQVCITGWMITPYFMLKRPGNINGNQYRLDYVLQSLAERGVKIFIICFMEPSLVVNNDSEHVQQHLESMHKNIKVYRHPNVAVPQLWSHHQKMVVIDQKIGFMGGLDICYGRWDMPDHRLVEQQDGGFWDGQEFNNYRLKDIYTPRVFYKTNLNKDFQPRMPWHDIAVQIRGDVVIDLLRHFVQYWFFVKSELSADPRVLFNLLQKRLSQSNQYTEKIEKQYLLTQLSKDTQQTFAYKFNSFKEQMGVFVKGGQVRSSQLFIEQRPGMNQGNLRIQMLRSASEWSIGLQTGKFQSSIHNAYIHLIENSQSFIYIENQFFMGLQNKIVEKLANRIIRAKFENKPFKVVVVMPLLPGFQGYIGDPAATVLRIQMHWQYFAISRGKDSLFKRLINGGIPEVQISKYIYFFGLRKGDVLNKIPVTQIIYVHSKLMIVDDKRVIVGSANINDRSLVGNRDSQIAICIEDDQKKQTNNFRRIVFEEHFGFTPNDSVDFIDQKVWNELITRAVKNTRIFRTVFACLPDDLVSKATEIDCFQEKHGDISSWFTESANIKGHAVSFPLDFLSKEDLTFKPNQKQFYAPDHAFT